MKERPKLFSAAMVRALLAGTKTQTRRIVKPTPTTPAATPWWKNGWLEASRCPHGQKGDQLWVQEEHQVISASGNRMCVWYPADGSSPTRTVTDRELALFNKRKRPFAQTRARFMYRSFSRLTLDIREVRVERVQSISAADAIAEGIEKNSNDMFRDYEWANGDSTHWFADPVESYRSLWRSINGADSWQANPWTWVISFAVVNTCKFPTE